MSHLDPSWVWGPPAEDDAAPEPCPVCLDPHCEGDAEGPGCVPRRPSGLVLATAVRPGETIHDALPLTPEQGEMTLLEYAAARCCVCGVQGVKTYARGPGRVCALCDGRTT